MGQNSYQGSGVYDWSEAYIAAPRYYRKPDGGLLGALAVNEGSETVLPIRPDRLYHPDGADIADWRLLLYSKTRQAVLGDVDFYTAVRILKDCVIDNNEERFLLRALSLSELDALLRKAGSPGAE